MHSICIDFFKTITTRQGQAELHYLTGKLAQQKIIVQDLEEKWRSTK